MRFVRMINCKPEMMVARAIYGPYGVLMLNEGSKLSPRIINALGKLGYPGLYIEDDFSKDVVPEEVIEDSMRKDAMMLAKEMFSKAALANKEKNAQAFEAISGVLGDMVDHVFASDHAVVNVPLLKSFDEYTYQHSVDVAVLCICLGKALNMSKSDVVNLGKTAFFHDIGKMLIPKAILNKPGKLTKEEAVVMRKHAERSFDFTKVALGQPTLINRGVLCHHERYDGTGYPFKLKGDEIPIFAQIIAIADVFDAMGSARVYRKSQLATEGYEYILASSGHHFSPKVVETFAKTIAPFPVGITVKLSNGLNGIVIRNNSSLMMRPLVRAFDPIYPGDYEYINLSNDPNALDITIVGVV